MGAVPRDEALTGAVLAKRASSPAKLVPRAAVDLPGVVFECDSRLASATLAVWIGSIITLVVGLRGRFLSHRPRPALCRTSRTAASLDCHIGSVPIAIVLTGGTWAFLGFLVLYFFAVAHGYYSRSGSAINQRPYNNGGGDAPGAEIPSTIGRDIDRRDFSRGTR